MKSILAALLLALGLAGGAIAAETVDINTADVEQLAETLNGIGDTKAEAIVEFREANGPFEAIDELVEVKGVGLRTVDKNRERMTVSGEG